MVGLSITLWSAFAIVDWPSGVIRAVSNLVVEIDSPITFCMRGVDNSSRTAFSTSELDPLEDDEPLPPELLSEEPPELLSEELPLDDPLELLSEELPLDDPLELLSEAPLW